jgi:hypothetical protein
MDAYILFGKDNEHWLAGVLDRSYRHVWCIIADHRTHTWVSYNWDQGLPVVRVEAALDFDVASFYTDQGWEVLDMSNVERKGAGGMFVLNNCVGHVKSVLGIRGFSLTPYQLYKRLTAPPRAWRFTVPGFGSRSFSPAPLPPPPPAAVVAPKSEIAIAADKKLSEEEAARKKLQKKAAAGSGEGTLLDDDQDAGLLKGTTT